MGDQLEKQQKTDQLKNNLKNRENLENLHKQNIITPNVAPQIAAKQRELEKAKKTDIIQQKLNDKDRPNKQELENQDILYSQTMASSLQSNAKDLEHKIRRIQNSKEEEEEDDDGNTSSPSIDQSATQTDI